MFETTSQLTLLKTTITPITITSIHINNIRYISFITY